MVKYTCTHPCNLASIQKINYFRVCTVPLEGNCSLTIPGQRNHVLKVYKSWTDNSLTAQVMVYSHIFQHQHTKGIFADTFLPYQSPASSLSRRVPRGSTAHIYSHQACILQFSMSLMHAAKPASISPGNLQICFAVGPNCQPKSSRANQVEVFGFRNMYKSNCAVPLKLECLWDMQLLHCFLPEWQDWKLFSASKNSVPNQKAQEPLQPSATPCCTPAASRATREGFGAQGWGFELRCGCPGVTTTDPGSSSCLSMSWDHARGA